MPPKRKFSRSKIPSKNEDSGDELKPTAPKLQKRQADEKKPVKKNVSGKGKMEHASEKKKLHSEKVSEQEKSSEDDDIPVKKRTEVSAQVSTKRMKKTITEEVNKPSVSNKTETSWDKINFTCTKENEEGQKHNLKISSWNIGGLKSWVKKSCLKFLEYEEPDIMCFQETKCSEEKLPEEIKTLKSYNLYWCASNKDGYAGVGFLTKTKPLKVSYGINVPEMDEDGRCITAEYKDFYVICVYVPNAGRKLVTLPKRLQWNTEFKNYVKNLDAKKPVIICGDMNVAHTEIDLARPKNNTKNAGFTEEEREGMTDFLQSGFVDVFRKLYPDKTDMYTFWTYMANARAKNVGWRLDYFIVSERIINNVCDLAIRSEVMGSDHCPITLFINI